MTLLHHVDALSAQPGDARPHIDVVLPEKPLAGRSSSYGAPRSKVPAATVSHPVPFAVPYDAMVAFRQTAEGGGATPPFLDVLRAHAAVPQVAEMARFAAWALAA